MKKRKSAAKQFSDLSGGQKRGLQTQGTANRGTPRMVRAQQTEQWKWGETETYGFLVHSGAGQTSQVSVTYWRWW